MSAYLNRWNAMLQRNQFSEMLPWLSYDETNQLIYLDGGYLGCMMSAFVMSGADDRAVKELASAVALEMPAGTFVQILRLNVPDVSDVLGLYQMPRMATLATDTGLSDGQKRLLQRLTDTTVDFMEEKTRSGAFPDSHVPLTQSHLIVSIKIPSPEIPGAEHIKFANERVAAFMSAAQPLHLRKLDNGAALRIWRRMLHMHAPWESWVDSNRLLRDQTFGPGDVLHVKKGGLSIEHDGKHDYIKVFSTKFFPENMSLAMMNHVIGDPFGSRGQITKPYAMSWTIRVPDQVAKRRYVTRQSQVINYQAFGPILKWVPKLAFRKKGVDALIERMNSGDALIECSFNLILWNENEEEAARASTQISSTFSGYDFRISEDTYIGFPMFFNCLPLFASEKSVALTARYQSMSSMQAIQAAPVLGDWVGTTCHGQNPVCSPGAGTLLITRRGHPMWADPFSTTGNFNFVIAGDAGSGKSFFAQEVVKDQLSTGGQVWIIEIGRSFQKLCNVFGGDHLVFDEHTDVGLNPFSVVESLDDELDELKALIGSMIDPKDELSGSDMSTIGMAIRSVFGANGRNATPTHVKDFLYAQEGDQRARTMSLMMHEFCDGGAYGHWFNRPMNVDLKGRFVVLELEELNQRPHLQLVVLQQFMFAINRQMQLGRRIDAESGATRRRMLFVDEASELLKIKIAAEFMEAASRRVRKLKGSLGIGLQRVADLYQSEHTKVIASQAETFFILKQKSESIAAIKREEMLILDPYAFEMLSSVQRTADYSEIFVYQGGNIGLGRLTADRFRQVLYSTSGAERDEILNAIESGVDAETAILAFIEREKQYRKAA